MRTENPAYGAVACDIKEWAVPQWTRFVETKMQREVRIWKTSAKVKVDKTPDGHFEAVGSYKDREIKVTGPDADGALRAWVAEARSKGV